MEERERVIVPEIKNAELKQQLEGRQSNQILLQQIKYLENVQEILLKAMEESEFDYSVNMMEISKLIFSMVKEIELDQ